MSLQTEVCCTAAFLHWCKLQWVCINWGTKLSMVNKTKHNQLLADIWDDLFEEQQNISTLWDRQTVRYYILIERHSNLFGSCITCIQHKYTIDESHLIIASNYQNYLPCRWQLPAWGNICKSVWSTKKKSDFFLLFLHFLFSIGKHLSTYLFPFEFIW